jgi:tRNA(Ile)-lysidine synthase
VAPLLALDAGWRARVLRAWVLARGMPALPGAATETITHQVLAVAHDREARYRWCGAELRRWADRLYAVGAPESPAPPDGSLAWNGRAPLRLPDASWLRFEGGTHLDLDSAFGACTVGPRLGGERIRLPGRAHSHALKECLRDAGMPPWERARLPLLRDGEGAVLAAGEDLVSARLQAWCESRGTRLRWRRNGAD